MTKNYALRKIPTTTAVTFSNKENNDKIKILELMNIIDEWEKEVLFSETGFYSLKGKNIENKTKEFIKELEEFISSQINKIIFLDDTSRQLALKIKKMKLDNIQKQMQVYESSQLKNWEIEVYENNIKYCIQRAVLYKNTPQVINDSYENAMNVLRLISEREKWTKKTFVAKKELFESDFYFELINAFIVDKEAKASFYFDKYKDRILDDKKEILEKSIILFKNNVLAYNWAKELFSYNLPDDKNDKEINSIEDKEIQSSVRHYFSTFKLDESKLKEKNNKENNETNWKEVIAALGKDPNKAELYIDFTLDKESINAKKSYIKSILKNGFIRTDKNKFLSIFENFISDFENFKFMDLSNFQKCLSNEDYQILQKFKEYSNNEYILFSSDYDYALFLLKKEKIQEYEKMYDFLKIFLASKEMYVLKKKEEPDIEERNKIIKSIIERYLKK